MTKAEWHLWAHLRGGALGASFRRQHPIGPYFVDFYCAPLKIAVELDGSQHVERARYDEVRTKYLNERGIFVLRFWNNEAIENLESVCMSIMDAIRLRRSDQSPDQ